jgi:hypothetical protein
MINPVVYGGIGGAIILIAYLTELFEHISPENKWFLTANIVGSIFLFYYAYLLGSIVFMITNAVWVLGSAYELWVCRKH